MSDSRDRDVNEALVDWDPAARQAPLDPTSVSTLRRVTLEELSHRVAGESSWFWPAGLAVAAVLALAVWLGWGFESPAPRQARELAADPTPERAAVTPVAPSPPALDVPERGKEPATAVPPSPTRVAETRAAARQSRIDFRTASGTRVIWVMRTDFQSSERTDSF